MVFLCRRIDTSAPEVEHVMKIKVQSVAMALLTSACPPAKPL